MVRNAELGPIGNDCYQICYFWDIGKVPFFRGQRVTRHRVGTQPGPALANRSNRGY